MSLLLGSSGAKYEKLLSLWTLIAGNIIKGAVMRIRDPVPF
jgi:hypothetical protein